MPRPVIFILVAFGFLALRSHAADPPKLELKDGDRIVYLGNTFVERDANYGYLETLLTIRHPDINFTFRNLGWSGDTVWGDARARFGTRADGFKHLKDHVLALKPTLILVAYGMNESFAGEAGLKDFEAGLNTLLDTLAETKAKIVLISPIRHEALGLPLPDPAKHNEEIGRYTNQLKATASSRNLQFIDLFERLRSFGRKLESTEKPILTDDGLHPTEYGYSMITTLLNGEMLKKEGGLREIRLKDNGTKISTKGLTSENLQVNGPILKFDAVATMLEGPKSPDEKGGKAREVGGLLSLENFKPGKYALKVDGVEVSRFKSDGLFAVAGMSEGPEIDQVDKLRVLINKKNELYFHRWRPQNETYLFGFRKHEQGNNAVEIPQFDPLIAELEAEINKLKKPVEHTYEIIREGADK